MSKVSFDKISIRELGVAALVLLSSGLALTAAAVCNSAPVAAADVTATYNELIVVDPLANDLDAEGQALSVTILTSSCLGSVSLDAFGLISFQPSQPLTASCQISYRVRDELGLADTANIVVNSAPPPVAIFSDGFESGNTFAWSSSCSGC